MIFEKQKNFNKITNRNNEKIYIELPFLSVISKEKHIPVEHIASKNFMTIFPIFEKMIFLKQKISSNIMNRNNGKRYIELPCSSRISKEKHTPVKTFPSKYFMKIFPRILF